MLTTKNNETENKLLELDSSQDAEKPAQHDLLTTRNLFIPPKMKMV